MRPAAEPLWRVFCAVELPGEVRARVAEYAKRLRAQFPRTRASWERPEKLHLTLKFVGEVEASRVTELSEAAARAASLAREFETSVGGTGVFPPKGPPRVLWLGVSDESLGLVRLRELLEDECAAAGFQRDARAFRPHLTITRLRDPRGAAAVASEHLNSVFASATFRVCELRVLRSELGPAGSRYTTVSLHTLGRAG